MRYIVNKLGQLHGNQRLTEMEIFSYNQEYGNALRTVDLISFPPVGFIWDRSILNFRPKTDEEKYKDSEITKEQILEKEVQKVISAYENNLKAITSLYPEDERAGWIKKETLAREWLAESDKAAAKLLSKYEMIIFEVVSSTGASDLVTKVDALSNRVIENADKFSKFSAASLRVRNSAIIALRACVKTKWSELQTEILAIQNAIVWPTI